MDTNAAPLRSAGLSRSDNMMPLAMTAAARLKEVCEGRRLILRRLGDAGPHLRQVRLPGLHTGAAAACACGPGTQNSSTVRRLLGAGVNSFRFTCTRTGP